MSKKERGLHELYNADPLSADANVFGRHSDATSRRGFLRGCGQTLMAATLGGGIVHAPWLPGGLIPAALAGSAEPFVLQGKSGLIVHNDRPVNAETPAHLLDDLITPAEHLFVRNNGRPPVTVDEADWTLTVEGESAAQSKTFSLTELKKNFTHHTLQLQLECGGNGRREFVPAAPGNQWSVGAVGCPRWTGVRLKDVLNAVGLRDNAVYVAYYGADQHLSGDPNKAPISRGVPMHKALEDETLIAFAMNGAPIPAHNGHPLRLVCAGWPGSVSGKWLSRIVVRDRIHDGPKMMGQSYRVPCKPVAPGSKVPDEEFCIIESMPVRSLITRPRSGLEHPAGKALDLRGHAWAGDRAVAHVHVSTNFGATWHAAKLEAPANRLAWQHWNARVTLKQPGYYELWARATDEAGLAQPMVVPGWNPKGYLNNACHRIAVLAT
ncbi:MAG: sulfite oxidase [Gammaproteobacteria bacterium]